MTNETNATGTIADGVKAEGRAKPESIRNWYNRTTRGARSLLFWATIVAVLGGVAFFCFVPLKIAAFLQTANGAVTIPISAAIWIFGFIYIFLIPSREVGFRSQEALERTVEIVNKALEEKLSPALDVWKRIGERVEAEIQSGIIAELRTAADKLKTAADRVQASAQTSNGELQKLAKETKDFTDEAKPALQALKRIQAKIEYELSDGFFEKCSAAMESVRNMSLPASKTEKAHDPAKALDMLRRGKAAPQTSAVVQPPRAVAVAVATPVPPVQS